MAAAALPYILQYGVPIVAYAIGHVVGWYLHKHVAARAAPTPPPPIK